MKKSGGKSNAAAADVSFQQLVDLFGAHISLLWWYRTKRAHMEAAAGDHEHTGLAGVTQDPHITLKCALHVVYIVVYAGPIY